jgi:glycosyltransferase involved in cell wall biosynthesis
MKKTRVLIASGFSAYFKRGGGEFEAASLCRFLSSRGFDAEMYGPQASGLETFNFVIFFSCHPSGVELLQLCLEQGVKFVFWPNFWVEQGRVLGEDILSAVSQFNEFADRIVFKSDSEVGVFSRHFALDRSKMLRVDWFVDSEFMERGDPDRFRAVYGLNEYILSVGLVEPIKNQLPLIKAVRRAGKKLVLIGGVRSKGYYDLCQDAAGGTAVFIPNLPANSPVLMSAYAGCQVYAEVSYDPPGRSALEAACFGKPLVLSHTDWTKEVFHDLAAMVDPGSEVEIDAVLSRVHDLAPLSSKNRNAVANRHSPDVALSGFVDYLSS